MTSDPLIETVREALYAASRAIGFRGERLAPVPGLPVGDAHLALDALAARLEAAERDLAALEGAVKPCRCTHMGDDPEAACCAHSMRLLCCCRKGGNT